jgi:hypothetical protein
LNTDSGKSRKVFSLKPESVFNLNQNRRSDWIRMGVQVEPEYAIPPCVRIVVASNFKKKIKFEIRNEKI